MKTLKRMIHGSAKSFNIQHLLMFQLVEYNEQKTHLAF